MLNELDRGSIKGIHGMGGASMKVLVASWGDFSRWEEVVYKFEDKEFTSKSTLSALCNTIKPNITVIFIPDTLGRDLSSIENLYKKLKESIKDFISSLDVSCDVTVEIVPGIGAFKHGSFIGNAMDAYYLALYKLYKILPKDKNLEVHFDVTHGLNYVTFLVYRALRDLLEILALRRKIHLKAYSSDPFVRGVKELTMHVIEDVDVRPQPLFRSLSSDNKYLKNRDMPKEEFGNLCRRLDCLRYLRMIKRDLNAWMGSIIFGLPLAFASFYPDTIYIEKAIDELVNAYMKNIEIVSDDGKRCIVRRLSFGEDFGTLIKILFIAKVTEDLPHGDELSEDDLLKITDELFKGGSVKYFIKNEIGMISRLIRSYTVTVNNRFQWIKLRDLLRSQGRHLSEQVDVRNFFAHAGLEANLTEIKSDGKSYLRYTTDKVLYGGLKNDPREVIKDIIEKGLFQGQNFFK
ncbi:MAG TPA: TIGR01897 family CRISPR-associated protein, partial [Euryarchaeota archaeon]|nr:TIGR01897 family CRISPR-associated protein [Euryarchaeota archaeon]